MPTVTGFTAARSLEIENKLVEEAEFDVNGHLILTKKDGSTIDAGEVPSGGGGGGSSLPVYGYAQASCGTSYLTMATSAGPPFPKGSITAVNWAARLSEWGGAKDYPTPAPWWQVDGNNINISQGWWSYHLMGTFAFGASINPRWASLRGNGGGPNMGYTSSEGVPIEVMVGSGWRYRGMVQSGIMYSDGSDSFNINAEWGEEQVLAGGSTIFLGLTRHSPVPETPVFL